MLPAEITDRILPKLSSTRSIYYQPCGKNRVYFNGINYTLRIKLPAGVFSVRPFSYGPWGQSARNAIQYLVDCYG